MAVRDHELHLDMDTLQSADPFELSKMADSDQKRNEIIRRVLKGELTERQRRCIILYFGQRLTLDEVGQALGINKSTVHKHIRLGKLKLKKHLEYSGEKGSLHFFE